MTANGTFRMVAAGTLVLGASLWLRAVISAEPKPAVDASKPSLTETLGGEARYLAHVSTDKPVYKPGENVYLRGVVLHANTRKPLEATAQTSAMVQIKGPKGEIVSSGYAGSQDSVIGFSWPVPKEQAGGQYTAVFTFPQFGHPPAERKFEVRSYRAPRLKSQIVFVRDGYGPGDTVTASAKVERAEGGVPAEAKVTVIARVDGEEVHQSQTQIDSVGNIFARFELPKEIARGDGTLAFVIEDGGIVETASKTIPILLQTVDLQMYPEGGDLIAGLPNRVYLSALTPAKKPADLAGAIVDGDGNEVAQFRTEHEGRGRVSFTPKAGAKYELKITEPAGIKTKYPLPEIKPQGIVISTSTEVFGRDEPVTLNVASSTSQSLKVTLARRDVQVATANVKASAGKATDVSLKIEAKDPNAAEGVLIATVWDANGRPLAERLIFREPEGDLRVSVQADRDRYTPGSPAKLTVKTTDADGKPVSAVVGLTGPARASRSSRVRCRQSPSGRPRR